MGADEVKVVEKRPFDFRSSREMAKVTFFFPDYRQELDYDVKLCPAFEIKKISTAASLKPIKIFGAFDLSNFKNKKSKRIMILARKSK